MTGVGNGVLNVTLSLAGDAGARWPPSAAGSARCSAGVASGTQLVAFAAGGALAAHLSPRTVFVLAGGSACSRRCCSDGRWCVRRRADAADSVVMTSSPAAA